MTAELQLCVWRPLVKNTLRGFLTVRYGSLEIADCAVHAAQNGRAWVSLPARPIVEPDGTLRRDERGKVSYTQILQWATPAARESFSAGAIGALLQRYPNALDGESATLIEWVRP